MELFFVRPSENRSLTFNEVASALYIPKDVVERLVMKAMSIKLLKGHLDEVQERIIISWVQPRVLDMKQLQKMKTRLVEWTSNVKETLLFMESESSNEIFT